MLRALALLALAACAVDRAGAGAGGSTSTSTSSSTTATSAAPTTGDASTTGGPVDGSSGTTVALDEECSESDQACPPGQKCTWVTKVGPTWDDSACVPAVPDGGGLGDPCAILPGESPFSGLDDCAVGLFCLYFDFETGEGGRCVEFCDEAEQCPQTDGGAGLCIGSNSNSLLGICFTTCDPLLQDCAAGEACLGDLSLPQFICAAFDVAPGAGEDGSPCEFTNACLPGLSCESAERVEGCPPGALGCCTPFCPVGDDGLCAAGEDCRPFFPDPPADLADVGVCVLPG